MVSLSPFLPPLKVFERSRRKKKSQLKVLKVPELMKYRLLFSSIKATGNLMSAAQTLKDQSL